MRHSWGEIIAGALVLVLAVGFLAYAAGTIGGIRQVGGYHVSAKFNSVEGIAVGDQVRMAGIPIGEVSDIRLNNELFIAELEIRVDEGIGIPTDSEIKIASEGLLGGSFVEIVPGADDRIFAEGDAFSYATGATDLLSLFANFAIGGGE